MLQKTNCPNCKSLVEIDQKFCGVCGTALIKSIEKITTNCPGCGSPIIPEQKYCGVCGMQLSASLQQYQTTKQIELTQEKVSSISKVGDEKKLTTLDKHKTKSNKYGILRVTAMILNIIGWIILIGGALISIAMIIFSVLGGGFQPIFPGLETITGNLAIIMGVISFVCSLIYGFTFLAFAQLCFAIIEIANTISQ